MNFDGCVALTFAEMAEDPWHVAEYRMCFYGCRARAAVVVAHTAVAWERIYCVFAIEAAIGVYVGLARTRPCASHNRLQELAKDFGR